MKLKNNFPNLHEAFNKGDFVVHRTERKRSGVHIGQALENEYNKPAKEPGGVITIA